MGALQAPDNGAQARYFGVPAVHVAAQAGIVLLQAAHPLRQLLQLALLPHPAHEACIAHETPPGMTL